MLFCQRFENKNRCQNKKGYKQKTCYKFKKTQRLLESMDNDTMKYDT